MSRGSPFRVLHKHVEVAVVVEDSGVEQFVLRVVPPAALALLAQFLVREARVRVLVEELQVRVRRGGVEVVVHLLHVFAVIPLLVLQPKESLLEDRVFAVPQRDRETQVLHVVADPAEAVLAPPVRAAVRVPEGEVRPRVAGGRVVLAHGAPLAVGEVWPPPPPRGELVEVVQAIQFRVRIGHERTFQKNLTPQPPSLRRKGEPDLRNSVPSELLKEATRALTPFLFREGGWGVRFGKRDAKQFTYPRRACPL
jgi:hypothetical protein